MHKEILHNCVASSCLWFGNKVRHTACVIVPRGSKQVDVMGTNVYSCQITYLITNGLSFNRRCGFEEEKYTSTVKLCSSEMPL